MKSLYNTTYSHADFKRRRLIMENTKVHVIVFEKTEKFDRCLMRTSTVYAAEDGRMMQFIEKIPNFPSNALPKTVIDVFSSMPTDEFIGVPIRTYVQLVSEFDKEFEAACNGEDYKSELPLENDVVYSIKPGEKVDKQSGRCVDLITFDIS